MNTDALIKKASDAVNAQNYDYAIELMLDLIRREPANAKARQALWVAGKRKLGDKKPSTTQALYPHIMSFIHALMGKREQIVMDCEQILLVDPNNVAVRNKLAKAAEELGYKDTALVAYESARESDAKDIEALRQLGRMYRERFEADRNRRDLELALQRFEQLLQVKSTDAEAKNAAQALAALRATIDGGWDTTESYRDVIKDQDAAKAAERGQDRLVQLEDDIQVEINQTIKAIEKEPERSSLRIKLGDLYMQKQRFKSAEEAYREGQRVDATNTLIRAKLGDVKLVFMETRVEQLKEKLKAGSDPAVAKEVAELEATHKEFRIKEYRQRVQDQPTNMEYHFALGRMLYEGGDMDGAMGMFQRTISDPRYRLVANHMLGKCLVAKGMYDRAVSTFTRALEGTAVMNEAVKGLYYDLGLTYEQMKDWKNAEHAYGKIYDSDIGYRDVAQKMDAVYKKARQEGEESSS